MGGRGEIDMKIKSKLDASEAVEHVEVVVRTPNGTWPTEGFFEVPVAQKIALQLSHAATSLKIEDTRNWVASADGMELDPDSSYRENGLSGRAYIWYRPPEKA
jgi:hypothetical protein